MWAKDSSKTTYPDLLLPRGQIQSCPKVSPLTRLHRKATPRNCTAVPKSHLSKCHLLQNLNNPPQWYQSKRQDSLRVPKASLRRPCPSSRSTIPTAHPLLSHRNSTSRLTEQRLLRFPPASYLPSSKQHHPQPFRSSNSSSKRRRSTRSTRPMPKRFD